MVWLDGWRIANCRLPASQFRAKLEYVACRAAWREGCPIVVEQTITVPIWRASAADETLCRIPDYLTDACPRDHFSWSEISLENPITSYALRIIARVKCRLSLPSSLEAWREVSSCRLQVRVLFYLFATARQRLDGYTPSVFDLAFRSSIMIEGWRKVLGLVLVLGAGLVCPASRRDSRPLHLAGLFPMGGVGPGSEIGPGVLPAVELACHHVNRAPGVLSGYKLEINWNDTQVGWLLSTTNHHCKYLMLQPTQVQMRSGFAS